MTPRSMVISIAMALLVVGVGCRPEQPKAPPTPPTPTTLAPSTPARGAATSSTATRVSGGVFAVGTPSSDPGRSDRALGTQADAIKLCERLAGTERDLCMRQARELGNASGRGGVGATPGSGGSATGGDAPPSDTARHERR